MASPMDKLNAILVKLEGHLGPSVARPGISGPPSMAQYDKSLKSLTKSLDKQTKSYDREFKGATAFSQSKVAKALGLDKPMTQAIMEARAAKGDIVARKMLADQAKAGGTPDQIEAKERMKMRMGYGGQGLGQMADALQSNQAGEVIGKSIAAIGNFGKSISPDSKTAGAVVKFGEFLAMSTTKLREWGERLRLNDMRLAEVSGPMASVMAQAEVADIRLNQIRGRERADSARRREQSRIQLEQAVMPLENWWANLQNNIQTGINTTGAGAVGSMLGLPSWVSSLIGMMTDPAFGARVAVGTGSQMVGRNIINNDSGYDIMRAFEASRLDSHFSNQGIPPRFVGPPQP